jgi:N-acetylglucosaminyldiphosphoundecaprenol N-acetyl-beta-D-mannosaminyltransferase
MSAIDNKTNLCGSRNGRAVNGSTDELGFIPVHNLMGVRVHAATMVQVLSRCSAAIRARTPLLIGVVNAAKIVNMRRQPILNESVASSDLVLADGMAVVWASRVLRRPLPERVAGIDLFENLLALADEHGYSVFFLGAAQDVLDEVLREVRHRYPNARIAGSRNGYFSDEQSEQVAQQIAKARPDMLFLGMTSPKKEIFMAKWGPRMDVTVVHGVGGSFDVMAGKVKRAPLLWQRLGIEWLYRVVQEPRRMWKRYLVTNSIFTWMLLSELLRRPFVYSGSTAGH